MATRGDASSGRGPSGRDLLVHAESLYRLARRLGGSPTEAEDLVQETYLRAVRALERVGPCGDVRAWLHRIMRNAWLDGSKWAVRHPGSGGLEDDELAGVEQDVLLFAGTRSSSACAPSSARRSSRRCWRSPSARERSCSSTWKDSPKRRSQRSRAVPSGRSSPVLPALGRR